ncbi:MAG: hypothetical protein ACJ75G_08755 [Gaiellaceae bacterium]
MRHRFAVVVAVLALGLVGVGSAAAFDCIRVSSSLQGLQQATKSGNWLLFDFSSAAGVQQTFAIISGGAIAPTDEQAACFVDAYAESGQPRFFALGIGVAGGRTGQGPGVLAHNNPNDGVLSNGTGIDHLDDSAIVPALFAAAETCGIDVSGLEG